MFGAGVPYRGAHLMVEGVPNRPSPEFVDTGRHVSFGRAKGHEKKGSRLNSKHPGSAQGWH